MQSVAVHDRDSPVSPETLGGSGCSEVTPIVSLVICSYNGARRLPACFDAVAALECDRPWEIVLVDNGSKDDTAAVMRAFATRAPVPVHYVHESVPGLGAARAAALAVVRGEIVACTDDDCYVAPDFLTVALAAFEDPGIGLITGRILLFDPQDAPVTIQLSREPRRIPAGEITPPGDIQGASFAFRRSAAIAAGGFDAMLGAGTPFPAEDFDFSLRMAAGGWHGAYVPELVVQHHHGRKPDAAAGLIRGYRLGAGAVFAKSLLDLQGLRWKVFVAWARQQYRWLRSEPVLMVYEWAGALHYLGARFRMACGSRRGAVGTSNRERPVHGERAR